MKLVIFKGDDAGFISTELREEVQEMIKSLIKSGETETRVPYDKFGIGYESEDDYEVALYDYDERLHEGVKFLFNKLMEHNYIGEGHDNIGIIFTDDDGCYLT